jgi:glycosyltransferase involved in cell wall biosynthesis
MMNKVKVIFFADMLIADFDGAVKTMYQLINKIPTDRFDFLFVCGIGPDCVAGFRCMRVFSLSVPGNKNYRFATAMFQRAELDKEIDRFSPDIIHISTPSLLGNYALKTAKRIGIPVISIYHTHFVSYVDYYVKNFPFLIDFTKDRVNYMLKTFYNQCDIVYVPSKTMIRELEATGVRPEVMKLWERGIDKHIFSPSKRNRKSMRDMTGNDNPCILFVSRLVWEKNLQTMIDIYQLAERNHLNCNFIIAGDGAARASLEKQMPKALFLGYLGHEKLATVYASSDVFLFPSVTETFGNVVLEAMATGLPCVIADSGGSKDFIRHGVNGFKCNPFDAQDFLNRISEITAQPALAEKFTEAGIETARKYVWENLAREYFEDLESLALKSCVV